MKAVKDVALIILFTALYTFLVSYLSIQIWDSGRDKSVKIEYKYKYKTIIDTAIRPVGFEKIRIVDRVIPVNIDSLYRAIKSKYDIRDSIVSEEYFAIKDTVYEDSLLSAEIIFVSKLPLDPGAYFISSFAYREKETIKIIPEKPLEPSFWNRFTDGFSLGLNTGIGYGHFTRRLDVYTGLGINIKLL